MKPETGLRTFYANWLGNGYSFRSPHVAPAQSDVCDWGQHQTINYTIHVQRWLAKTDNMARQSIQPARNHSDRACLDQLLIVIRSLTILCDHSRSEPRPIMITNLTAKLGIIYTTLHNPIGLCGLKKHKRISETGVFPSLDRVPVALCDRDISLVQFKRLLKTLWFV